MKKNQDAEFLALYQRAREAGIAAGIAAIPTPMALQVTTGLSGGYNLNRPPDYIVNEGACGFAWVSFAGNTAFGRWARKSGLARPGYPTGLRFWISDHGQSITRKEAHAVAMAEVLKEAGIKVYAESRLD